MRKRVHEFFIYLLSFIFILIQNGCILFTFVGGANIPLKHYAMPANAYKMVDAFDEYVLKNINKIERVIGYYDAKIDFRTYYFFDDSLRATFSFYGDSTGFKGEENISQLRLYYIKKGEKSFDADTKLNKKGKAELNLYVQKIESELIYPVKERLISTK